MHGERGDLPSVIAAELREEGLALSAVIAANRFRDEIHFLQIVKRAQFLDDALFSFGTGDGDAVEMLDGMLAGIGSLGRPDGVGQMADEGNALLVSFVGEREIGVAGYPVINLDEVGATRLDFVDGAARLV